MPPKKKTVTTPPPAADTGTPPDPGASTPPTDPGTGAPPDTGDGTPPDPAASGGPQASDIAALNLPKRASRARAEAQAATTDGGQEPDGAPGQHDAPLVEENPPDPTIENTDPAPGVFVGIGVSGIQTGDDVWLVDEETGVITGRG